MADEVIHEPCAFNPNGASEEFCKRMTSVLQHNRRGCCAINCTSPLRLCWKCITESKSPNLCADPITGLCTAHGSPSDASRAAKEKLKASLRVPGRESESSIWDAEPAKRPVRPKKPPAAEAPAPVSKPPRNAKAARPAKPSRPRKVSEQFRRPVPLAQLEYLLKHFRHDAEEMEKLAEMLARERAVLMSERNLTDAMRREMRERTSILKFRLETLIASFVVE
jgi:hypothetical protein